MNQTEALSVVRSLANGIDPESGEVFAADSVYQRAQTVRALVAAAEALEKRAVGGATRSPLPDRCRWRASAPRSMLQSDSFDSPPFRYPM